MAHGEGLDAEDAETRRNAARTVFRKSRNPRTNISDIADDIVTALDDDDPVVRGHLTAALGDAAFSTPPEDNLYDQDVLAALFERFTDEDESVRQTIAGALYGSEWEYTLKVDPDPQAAVGLVHCLEDDSDVTRQRVARSLTPPLAMAHPEFPDGVVPVLVDRLTDNYDFVRQDVGELLVGIARERPAVVSPWADDLVALLDDDCDEARSAATNALASLVGDHPQVADDVIDALQGLLAAGDKWEQAEAVESIGNVGATTPELLDQVVDVLVGELSSLEFKVRGAAASELAALSPSYDGEFAAVLETLAEAESERPLNENGVFPLAILAESHSEFASHCLVRLSERLNDPNLDARVHVQLAFTKVAEVDPVILEPAIATLIALLDSDHEIVRRRAVSTLSDIATEYPTLVAPVATEFGRNLDLDDSYVRWNQSEALLAIAVENPESVHPLLSELQTRLSDSYIGIRFDTASTMATVAHAASQDVPAVASTLADYLEREHPNALGQFGPIQYHIGSYTRSDDEPPFVQDDPKWPLAPIVEHHSDVVTSDDLEAWCELLPEKTRDAEKLGHALAVVAEIHPEMVTAALSTLATFRDDEDVADAAETALTEVWAVTSQLVEETVPGFEPDSGS